MKKNLSVSVLAVVLAAAMTVGVGAATLAQRVTAELRPDITVRVDGERQTLLDRNGDQVYPITYGGAAYLPVRALGETMGLEVEWNGRTQTVSLHTGTATEPAPSAGAVYQSYAERIGALDKRCDELAQKVENDRPAQGGADNQQPWRELERNLAALDGELDDLDDAIERDYRAGALTAAEYRALDKALDRADDRTDGLDDRYDNDHWDDDHDNCDD